MDNRSIDELNRELRGMVQAAIKDSGQRTEFATGAVRDMATGKGRTDLLPMVALLRLSRHYEVGAVKYGLRNWEKGIPVSSFMDSAIRHIFCYMMGWDDEDHLAAAAFNVLGAMQMEEANPDMLDLPMREGKRDYSYHRKASSASDTRRCEECRDYLTPGDTQWCISCCENNKANWQPKEAAQCKSE